MTKEIDEEIRMHKKMLNSRIRLAREVYQKALNHPCAETNPFFPRRAYWLVRNKVCDSLEDVLTHADR